MSTYLRDLAERVGWTFVEGFVGGLVLTQLSDVNMWYAAVSGGLAAVVSLVKGVVAKGVGNTESASLTRGV